MKIRLSILATAGLLTLVTASIASLQPAPELPLTQSLPNTPGALPKQPESDPTLKETQTQQFALHTSLEGVKQLDRVLDHNQKATSKNQPPTASQAKPGTGDAKPSQNRDVATWVETIEGTLRSQDYQIKKLELELAQKQYQDGEIPKSALDQKVMAYQKASQDFDKFWKSYPFKR